MKRKWVIQNVMMKLLSHLEESNFEVNCMSFYKIKISPKDEGIGQLGGGAWLERLEDWPRSQENGSFMLPLISFDSAFFPTFVIAPDYRITVFVPAPEDGTFSTEYGEGLSHNFGHTPLDPSKLSAKMLLHKTGAEELCPDSTFLLPKGYLSLEELTDEEFDLENLDEVNGIELSKRHLRAHWLRDMIKISPRYHLVCQLNELDLVEFHQAYKGIFNAGIGYVYLDYRIKKLDDLAEAGFFFIQYT